MKPRKTTDTYPITATLYSNGVPVNLTGYTVTLSIVDRPSRTVIRLNGACTITDAPNGKVSYQPTAPDVATAGSYDLEWKGVSGGGTIYHWHNTGYEGLTLEQSLG